MSEHVVRRRVPRKVLRRGRRYQVDITGPGRQTAPMTKGLEVKRLGEKVLVRRGQLDLTQVEFAELAGLTAKTISELERGRLTRVHAKTMAGIDKAAQWTPGSARRVLRGGHPIPVEDEQSMDPELKAVYDTLAPVSGLSHEDKMLMAQAVLAKRNRHNPSATGTEG